MKALVKKIKWWSTEKDLQLADIVNVMLNRRMLPLQLRAAPMWAHKPGDMGPLIAFFRSTLATMWTKVMKLAKDWIPKEFEDRGLEDGYEAPPVSELTHKLSFMSSDE